jgi:hypothetical protein
LIWIKFFHPSDSKDIKNQQNTFASLSHKINTPLSTTATYSEKEPLEDRDVLKNPFYLNDLLPSKIYIPYFKSPINEGKGELLKVRVKRR